MTPAGIEPATFRFVVQHLNHCATAVPIIRGGIIFTSSSSGGGSSGGGSSSGGSGGGGGSSSSSGRRHVCFNVKVKAFM